MKALNALNVAIKLRSCRLQSQRAKEAHSLCFGIKLLYQSRFGSYINKLVTDCIYIVLFFIMTLADN